jgi:hypothetical protein
MGAGEASGPWSESTTHPAPNQALEPTPNSFRSSLAPAIGRGSPRALGPDPSECYNPL